MDALRNWWGGLDRLERTCWQLRVLALLAGLAGLSRMVDSWSATPETVLELLEDALSWLALAAIIWLLIEAWRWWVRKRAYDLPRFAGWIKAPAPTPPEFVISEPPTALFP